MSKINWKPGNMLYPLPVVLISVCGNDGAPNVFTVAWTGTICSDPPMVSISVRPERYSHHMLEETGEFVINLTTKELVYATDYCGVRSGKSEDKWKAMKLTASPSDLIRPPLIAESPVNLECIVKSVQRLGSHDMYIAEIVAVHADEAYMDENHKFHLEKADPIVYSHGTYFTLGEEIGTFGYSVKSKS